MKNLLIIAGTNATLGAADLACQLISRLSADYEVVAVKVNAAFDKACKLCVSVLREEDYILLEERNATSTDDSSRMLAAGAARVWSIQAQGLGLQRCWSQLQKHLPQDTPLVVVSDELAHIEHSAALVLLQDDERQNDAALASSASCIVMSDDKCHIHFEEGFWLCSKI